MKQAMKKIDKYIRDKQVVAHWCDEKKIRGQILAQSKDTLVLHQVDEWHFDGFLILAKKIVSNIQYGSLEIFQEKVLRSEHPKVRSKIPSWLDCSDWNSMLTSLKNKQVPVCVQGKPKARNFAIGLVDKIDDKIITLIEINTKAKLCKTETTISRKNIAYIFFGDEYSSVLSKHIR